MQIGINIIQFQNTIDDELNKLQQLSISLNNNTINTFNLIVEHISLTILTGI